MKILPILAFVIILIGTVSVVFPMTQTGNIITDTQLENHNQMNEKINMEARQEFCDDYEPCTEDHYDETVKECEHVEIVCEDSIMICPDEYRAVFKNICVAGRCSNRTPDCSAHQLKEECKEIWSCSGWSPCFNGTQERICENLNACDDYKYKPEETRNCVEDCKITCQACEELDINACKCIKIVPCKGNGICEKGEYPSSDCPDCNDNNVCSIDSYDYSSGQCKNEPIIPCCGNNQCETGENHDSCPQDCDPEPEVNYVIFSEVYYDTLGKESEEEWIELYNPKLTAVDLTGYTISDYPGNWSIPPGTVIQSNSYIIIARNAAGFNNLYNFNSSIDGLTLQLSNTGDMLSLKNADGIEIDFVAWGNYTGWGISAGDNKSIRRVSVTQDMNSTIDWLSEQIPEPANV